MIKSWPHKGLQDFFETGSLARIQSAHACRLAVRLITIDKAKRIEDIAVPAYRLHKLKGSRSNVWSISVSGNWRITFCFEGEDAYILNYEDYH